MINELKLSFEELVSLASTNSSTFDNVNKNAGPSLLWIKKYSQVIIWRRRGGGDWLSEAGFFVLFSSEYFPYGYKN